MEWWQGSGESSEAPSVWTQTGDSSIRLLKAAGREAKTNCSLWTLLSPGICKQMRQIRRFTPKLGSKSTQSSSHLSKPQWTSRVLRHVHSKPQFISPFVRFHYVPSQFLICLSIFSAAITQMLKCKIQKMGSRRFMVNMSSIWKERTENAEYKQPEGAVPGKCIALVKEKNPCIVPWAQGPLGRGKETESFAFHTSGLDSTVPSPLQSHSFLPVWTTSFFKPLLVSHWLTCRCGHMQVP